MRTRGWLWTTGIALAAAYFLKANALLGLGEVPGPVLWFLGGMWALTVLQQNTDKITHAALVMGRWLGMTVIILASLLGASAGAASLTWFLHTVGLSEVVTFLAGWPILLVGGAIGFLIVWNVCMQGRQRTA